ncbi:MAG: serine protease [Myxococcota bacterium]
MRSWSCLVAPFVAIMLAVGAASALELPELAEQTKPSVVHLEVVDAAGDVTGSGTGFFVSPDRIVTNDHVVADAAGVRAKLTDGEVVDLAGTLATDADRDLAILALPPGVSGPAPLRLGDSSALRQGDEVVVIGSPRGLAGTLSVGIVSALRGEGLARDGEKAAPGDRRATGAWAIQITAAISPGSSGSPIMTREGDVVAVAVGILTGGANIGFGVPIDEVKTLLRRIGPDARPTPFADAGGGDVLRNLIVSGVFFALIGAAYAWSRYRDRPRRTKGRGPRPSRG